MKICLECKWFEPYNTCTHPKAPRDSVSGVTRATTNRIDPWPIHLLLKRCGVVGRYWEKKDENSSGNDNSDSNNMHVTNTALYGNKGGGRQG